jgi:hypothetical protein
MNDLELMQALDDGGNMFGALPSDIRVRLFAVLDTPTEQTWNDAHSIVVAPTGFIGITLWQALLRHTDYAVTRGPSDGGPWSAIPTREQLCQALRDANLNQD